MKIPKYIVLEKKVGETPLSCAETYRAQHPELAGVPLAYAGRLDPLASGKLLVLVGDECKQQEKYHGLDKEYVIDVVLGVGSDTGDVMGRLQPVEAPKAVPTALAFSELTEKLSGKTLSLPYPAFSAKTVQGKPLHTWAVEGRLHEITIPKQTAPLYAMSFLGMRTIPGYALAEVALAKMNTIPPVTDLRKALGNDFRRGDIREDWHQFAKAHDATPFVVATFRVSCGSGMYMRTLANEIAKHFGAIGLCLEIHRAKIGKLRTFLGFKFFQNI
ncbi:hypothetical protein A3C89_00900 [Candidatus Kaiserbacteria bacterium RIFCSPHIGHO2_02_FULL_50_50]|uniref:tRNA pseudouridine(55) synthase n=1 Tax=Candidatus Kaiserbacteria bacterium RIFCSPHIGHO2_02_FULL_50_50 TaxID=1798492 RepID=A0A1F6DFU0_9BACT|nr:MAG: hypothetical protein A3C89_00900 [Candidatus Kaiserbacteria bacterium RIFCSPHIGHO2_02_FULL_50_50]